MNSSSERFFGGEISFCADFSLSDGDIALVASGEVAVGLPITRSIIYIILKDRGYNLHNSIELVRIETDGFS